VTFDNELVELVELQTGGATLSDIGLKLGESRSGAHTRSGLFIHEGIEAND
jgi:hypothetical protein